MTLNADALIIGIDRYDCADIEPLPGCVNDAAAATKWLIAIGVPPERIIAHVSPLDPDLFPDGVVVRTADDAAIRASFKTLEKSGHGDKLFFFMSGHGKYVPGAGPVFLCQDYFVNESTRENLKIEEYIDWFRSWRYRDQFLFYDACQDATASIGQLSSVKACGPDALPGSYQPDSTVAFTTCYACSPGERAWAGDGRGVLIRYALEELDPGLWHDLHPDAPEQDAIKYDWTTGARVVDLEELFTNIIAVKITEAANRGEKYQTPFCEPRGRALVDGFSPVLDLPPQPTTTVMVHVDPQLAIADIQSIKLQSKVIPKACFMPFKGTPLQIPATLKFPQQDQLNAGCRLSPSSTWETVNLPLVQMLAQPKEDVVLQFRQPPPANPPNDDGRGEFNIVLDGGRASLPPAVDEILKPTLGADGTRISLGVTVKKDGSGLAIGFDPEFAGSILIANQIGVDWLKALRRYNWGTGNGAILSPPGQPKSLRPNITFDFGDSNAAEIAGYLQDDECVALDSLADEMPPRRVSLRDLEEHPVEWLEPGQCRISINLPWGRWSKRIRVGEKAVTVRLPSMVGLEPLRNRYKRRDPSGPVFLRRKDLADDLEILFSILDEGGRRFWGVADAPVPIVALTTEAGLRIEPYSATTLREWDQLLTVGRLDIDDPAGLVKRLDGSVPGASSAEDFSILALAAAYAEYNRQNWRGLKSIIEVLQAHTTYLPDIALLKLAVTIADERLVGNERQRAITYGLADRALKLPILRWGAMVLSDLARQAELALPHWVSALDSTSIITLINREGLPALGIDPEILAIQSYQEHHSPLASDEVEDGTAVSSLAGRGFIREHVIIQKKASTGLLEHAIEELILEYPIEKTPEEEDPVKQQMREE